MRDLGAEVAMLIQPLPSFVSKVLAHHIRSCKALDSIVAELGNDIIAILMPAHLRSGL